MTNRALTRLERDLGDPELIRFATAIGRSVQLLTGALMAEDSDLYMRLIRDAKAIGAEHGFSEDLRQACLEQAWENTGGTL